VAVVALVSPFEAARRAVADRHGRAGLPFFEVFLDTPLEICAARDRKGHYARARAGDLPGFTGIDAPYERPCEPNLHLTSELSLDAAVDAVLELIARESTEPDEGAHR
jgi:bifunctional enzyme CysN/CysC